MTADVVSLRDTGRERNARTREKLLASAMTLVERGRVPSIPEIALHAGVSRATAYRYFPSQAALVHAVVDEALGPILSWQSGDADPQARVNNLIASSMPRISEFEATFKAALKLSLEQWAERQAGTLGTEPPFKRGHRVDLLQQAIAPLESTLPEPQFKRLAQALSLTYGLEVLIVLKDIWGLAFDETREVALWAANALVRAAIAESGDERPGNITGNTASAAQ